ncbi:MAG: hypothetical protein J5I91_00280 [Bacteroidetes bacterium]|nr:hypothetical protein [Bacteroidota bacterium]
MKKVNTRGMAGANKHVLMAALTYNLKKYLKFTLKKLKIMAKALHKNKGRTESFLSRLFQSSIAAI